jgi:hypothetical protein
VALLFLHLQLLKFDIKLLEESLNFCSMKMRDDYVCLSRRSGKSVAALLRNQCLLWTGICILSLKDNLIQYSHSTIILVLSSQMSASQGVSIYMYFVTTDEPKKRILDESNILLFTLTFCHLLFTLLKRFSTRNS